MLQRYHHYHHNHHHHHHLQDQHIKRQINRRNGIQSSKTDDKINAISQKRMGGFFGIGKSGSQCDRASQSVCHTASHKWIMECGALDPLNSQDGQKRPKVAKVLSWWSLPLALSSPISLPHDSENILSYNLYVMTWKRLRSTAIWRK